MNAWCIEHHGASGLTQASRESTLTEEQAEEIVMQLIEPYTIAGSSPLAGNTVGACDPA